MQAHVLGAIDAARLRAYVAWVPVLPDDTHQAALEACSLVPDARARHFWDGHRALSAPFARVLGLPEGTPAWDVYLLYDRDAAWDRAPPRPAYWEHQLGDGPEAPKLDAAVFAERVRVMIAD